MVVRTALIPFACVTKNGVSVLVDDPAIVCSTANATYSRMRSVAAVVMVLFGAGLPLLFVAVLWWNRYPMYFDQLLRVRSEGESAATNPHISTRRRFRKLYEDYKVCSRAACCRCWVSFTAIPVSRSAACKDFLLGQLYVRVIRGCGLE